MRLKLPPYVHGYLDRHGHPRYYVRRRGQKKIRLPGQPFSREFMDAYAAALKAAEPIVMGAGRTVPGSVDMAAISYYASPAFEALAPGTRKNRRSLLERFRADHGSKRIGLMDARALQAILGKLTPANQRNLKKALRGLVDHGMEKGWIKIDPLVGLKLGRMKSKGHHTWTEDEIAQYCARHAPGTKARLALELLLQTGVAGPIWCGSAASTFAPASCRCIGRRPASPSTFRCCPRWSPRSSGIRRPGSPSWRPNRAGPTRRPGSASGFGNGAPRPACRPPAPRMACARRAPSGTP
jgi:hypothetical protein